MPGSSDEPRSDPVPAAATGTGLVRRRPGRGWLLAVLIVPVVLTAVLLVVRTGPTEDDLRNRSLAALDARGITGVQVDFSGRDATVVVPAGANADEARAVVAAVDGVRAARAELVRLGVPADRVVSRGYGQIRPLASNTTTAGRIANRRVEIKVTS